MLRTYVLHLKTIQKSIDIAKEVVYDNHSIINREFEIALKHP